MAQKHRLQLELQTAPAIPEGYVALPEAMEILGKSQATLERHVTSRTFPTRLIPRRGQRPLRVFEAKALEEYRNKEQHRRELRPPSAIAPKAPAAANGQALAITNFALEKIAAAGVGLTSALESYLLRKPDAPTVPITQKLWLSLEEAVEYSGLTRADLLRLVQAGTLVARKSGGWKILRASLEAFEG